MPNQQKIVLWSKKGCHLCEELKTYFEKKNVDYQNLEVEGNDVLRDVLEVKYGIRHVPVIEIGTSGKYQGMTEIDYDRMESLLSPEPSAVK